MQRSKANETRGHGPRRRPLLKGAASCAGALAILVLGIQNTQNAVANGDTRTISIRHMHTKEEVTITFKRDGRYDGAALEKLNWTLRDWRTDEPIRMDPRLFDVAWEVQRQVGSDAPFHVVSAYRSPGTNSMLRRRSRAVAKNSQHMLGKAMDFYLPDTPTARIREAGMRLQRGGVGFYPGAHTPFVHLDAGSVRSWPRMTRDQLVRLFPDEKTVHLPADGHPLAGYEVAKAEVMSRGGSVMGYAAADFDEGAVISSGRKSLWASLFGGDDEEADARPTVRGRGRAAAPRPQPTVMADANPMGDANSPDGGRFAVAAAPPPPVADTLVAERSRRLAPRPAPAPETQIAAVAPAAAPAAAIAPPPVRDDRPKLIDAPLPLARPRGLAVPETGAGAGTQIAALPQAGGALAFAPQPEQSLVLASLPPRRPEEIAASLEPAGRPVAAPLPPQRPDGLNPLAPAVAALSAGAASAAEAPMGAVAGGRLVAVNHPLPPERPRIGGAGSGGSEIARREAGATPIVSAYDSDRAGLDSLFGVVARTRPESKGVTVAKARTASGAAVRISDGPAPAAALGFSHAAPTDAATSRFSGPAVRSLPTNFVQQN